MICDGSAALLHAGVTDVEDPAVRDRNLVSFPVARFLHAQVRVSHVKNRPWVDHRCMATRCDCHWERVDLHPDLVPVLLRGEDAVGCPAHTGVREDTDTAV